MEGEGSGHDWWHIYRVWNIAKHIAKKENADKFIVELAALLHDIADWKFTNDEKSASKYTRKWLESIKVDEVDIKNVCNIIDNISFKGANVKNEIESLEGKIVQDADRLDALGAIGIGRAFAYGGFKGNVMYDPAIKMHVSSSFKEYKKSGKTTINHFYEKLLFLKDKMNTNEAKRIAIKRHNYMQNFLKQFFKEWNSRI
jgi:uncharacterized protein